MNDKTFFDAAMRWARKDQRPYLCREKPAAEPWPEWPLRTAGRHATAKIGNRTGEADAQ